MDKTDKKEYRFDAKGEILGRLVTRVALVLRGKDSATFSLNNPDLTRKVVVFNTDKLKFTGNKLKIKIPYLFWLSQWYKNQNIRRTNGKDSKEVFKVAVYGMLPKNRLRNRFIANLRLFKGDIK